MVQSVLMVNGEHVRMNAENVAKRVFESLDGKTQFWRTTKSLE